MFCKKISKAKVAFPPLPHRSVTPQIFMKYHKFDMVSVPSLIKICHLVMRLLFFIPRGKLKRLVAQFGPYSWIDYDWRSTSSLGRWITMLGIIFVVSLKYRLPYNFPSLVCIAVSYCFELMYFFFFFLHICKTLHISSNTWLSKPFFVIGW
jgi:hypothetical protein